MIFAEAMAAADRQLNLRATIQCVDSFTIAADEVMSATIDEGGQMPIGTVASARYTLELPNANGEYLRNGSKLGNRSLTGARVAIEIGVYHDAAWDWQPLGVFIVEKTSAREHDTRIRLTGNDPLISLDVLYEDKLTYRYNTTLGDILTHIKSKGFTINGSLATNSSAIVDFTPDWGEEPTLREVLGYVTQMGGSFVRCDRQGNIHILPANSSTNHTITTDKYLEFTDDERYFNFNRVKVLPNGAKKDRDFVEASVTSAEESAANTIVIENNPLFKVKSTTTYVKATTWKEGRRYYALINNKYTLIPNPVETSLSSYFVARTTRNTTNLQAMVNNLKNALNGLSFRAINFSWRGNPQVQIGDKVSLIDTRGVTTVTAIIQQALKFDNGFRSEISCPLDLSAVTPSVITSSGRVAQPYFGEGTLDGSVIIKESITGDLIVAGGISARNVAAKSLTADEIAAKTITAEEIAAKTITADEIAAGAIDADEIAAGAITAEKIGASQINATHIGANEVIADSANIKNGVITNLKVSTAGIDFAKLKDMVAGTAIITEGVGGQLYIARLAVTEANMVSLTVGELMLRTSSGGFVRLIADGQGGVTTQSVLVEGSNVANATIGGGKLIENTITARELNVASIFADTALIRAIKAANIDVADLFAAQATIDELNAVDIRGNEYLQLAVGDIKVGGANLLLNSDFQQETIWIKNAGSTLAYLYPDDATYNFEGKRSLCLKMPASGEASGYIYQEIAGLDVSSAYVFSFYYYIVESCKTLFGSSAFAAIQQLDADGSSISISRVLAESITAGEWSRCVVPVALDSACKKIRVYFYIATTVGQENQWFINNTQFEKGNKETQWRLSDKDPVSGLKTSHILMQNNLLRMDSGGKVEIFGSAVDIQASESEHSQLVFGDAFSVARDKNGNMTLAINGDTDDAIRVNNNPVLHRGNVVVSSTQPPSGRQTIWLQPNTIAQISFAQNISAISNPNYATGMPSITFTLAQVGSETMNAAGTYSVKVKFKLLHVNPPDTDNYTINGFTITLTKGSASLTIDDNTQTTFYGYQSKEFELTATTTNPGFTSSAGPVTCVIAPKGLKPYTSASYLRHAHGSQVEAIIDGPSSGGTAQACAVFYVL